MVTGEKIHRQHEQGLLPTVAWQLGDEPAVYALDDRCFGLGFYIICNLRLAY